MMLALPFLIALAATDPVASALPPGACRFSAFKRVAEGEWRVIRTARESDGTLVTTNRPFKASIPKGGVIEMRDAAGKLFLRMTQTDAGYHYEEPDEGGTFMGGDIRVTSCSVPDANRTQTIVEVGAEAGGDASAPNRVDDTLTVVSAGADSVTMTGSLRPLGSSAPYRWATTMTLIKTR